MRTLKVTFDVVSVSNPATTSNIIRYYSDIPEAIFDIIHDYLMLFFKCGEGGVGYVNISIKPDHGSFSKSSMERIRNIIVDRILDQADGNIPLTSLQKSLLIARLESGRPKK